MNDARESNAALKLVSFSNHQSDENMRRSPRGLSEPRYVSTALPFRFAELFLNAFGRFSR